MRARALRNAGLLGSVVAVVIAGGSGSHAYASCPETDRTGPWRVEDSNGRDFLLVPCPALPTSTDFDLAILTIYFDGRAWSRPLEIEVYPVASFFGGGVMSSPVAWLHPEADFDTTFQCRQVLPLVWDDEPRVDMDITSMARHMAETGRWTGLAVGVPVADGYGLRAPHLSVLGPCPRAWIATWGPGGELVSIDESAPVPADFSQHREREGSATNPDKPTHHEPKQPVATARPHHAETAPPLPPRTETPKPPPSPPPPPAPPDAGHTGPSRTEKPQPPPPPPAPPDSSGSTNHHGGR